MNIQSILILFLVLVIFAIVGYRTWKGRNTHQCGNCHVDGCAFKGKKYTNHYKTSDCKRKD